MNKKALHDLAISESLSIMNRWGTDLWRAEFSEELDDNGEYYSFTIKFTFPFFNAEDNERWSTIIQFDYDKEDKKIYYVTGEDVLNDVTAINFWSTMFFHALSDIAESKGIDQSI